MPPESEGGDESKQGWRGAVARMQRAFVTWLAGAKPGADAGQRLELLETWRREPTRRLLQAGEAKPPTHFSLRVESHGIVAADRAGNIVEWSVGAENLFERTANEALGQPIGVLFAAGDRPKFERQFELVWAHPERMETLQLSGQKLGGVKLNLEISLTLCESSGQSALGMVVRDITKQVMAERRLREAEKNWRDVASNSSDLLLLLDRSGTIVFANRDFPELGVLELIGANAVELLSPAAPEVLTQAIDRVFQRGTPSAYESRLVDPDGNAHWLWCRIAPQKEDAQVVQAVLSVTDLTERRGRDVELRRLAAIVQSTAEAVISLDAEGRVTSWNRGAEHLLGWTESEVLGRHIDFLSPPDRSAEELAVLGRLRGGEEIAPYETARVTKGGRSVPLRITMSALRDEAGIFEGSSALLRDLSEQSELRQNWERAKQAAETTGRLKDEFLANMSHEVRTPLNGIVGMADLLVATRLDDEQRSYLSTLIDACKSLRVVVDDILDFSKIEAGSLAIESLEFDLQVLLEGVVNLFRPAADRAGTRLSLTLPDNMPKRVVGDPNRIRQVLMNLVSNAVKFTERGSVAVRSSIVPASSAGAQSEPLRLRVEVIDTGVGITPEAQAQLFQAFAQADGSLTRRFGGTGLGLVISRRLLELMGGSLGVDSRVGAGSTFWFELSLGPAGAAGARSLRKASLNLPRCATDWKILVAEDNTINQQVISAMLRGLGCQVDVVHNGREAVERWKQSSYDAILMDCQMPEMSGFEATQAIRKEERGPRVPIIAVTAQAYAEDRERCERAGMDDHLAKPLTRSALKGILGKWLQLKSSPPPPVPTSTASPISETSPTSAAARTQVVAPAPVVVPAPAVPAVDPLALDRLLEGLGDGAQPLLGELVEVFIAEFPSAVQRLREALGDNALHPVAAEAHRMRSSTGNLAAPALSALCQRLEHVARAGDGASCLLLVQELEGEFVPVAAALRDYIAQLPNAGAPPMANGAFRGAPS
jgi:PAS domain S-box-containing protein